MRIYYDLGSDLVEQFTYVFHSLTHSDSIVLLQLGRVALQNPALQESKRNPTFIYLKI